MVQERSTFVKSYESLTAEILCEPSDETVDDLQWKKNGFSVL